MITASIVLYENNRKILLNAINSFLGSNTSRQLYLYLIDNSPTENLKNITEDIRVEYVFNPSNPGFGSAHNIAIKKAFEINSKYHLVLNPDVYFDDNVLDILIEYMDDEPNVGMIMPQILNEDGSIQNLPKLLPSPLSVFLRKIKKPDKIYKKFIDQYELRMVPSDKVYNTPILSGCFTIFRNKALKEVGLYDDRYFMYFEDWDLSRRMHCYYKTIYFPKVAIIHKYESGANKSKKLFFVFLKSALVYFNKWGWFFDRDRKRMNKTTLDQFS